MSRMAGILEEIKGLLERDQTPNPQLAGRHPSDIADSKCLAISP